MAKENQKTETKRGSGGVEFFTKITNTYIDLIHYHFPRADITVMISEIDKDILNQNESYLRNHVMGELQYFAQYPIDEHRKQLSLLSENFKPKNHG